DAAPEFVSRGGRKLANALDATGVDPAGRRCLDVGASTGGFTDCLLQRGAGHVVAVDVAYGELHWRLRTDPRVTVLERLNARALEPERLPWAPDLVVVDLSFISLAKVLPAVLASAHRRPDEVRPALDVLRRLARERGVTLRFDADEVRKHDLTQAEGMELDAEIHADVDLCLVLGGDGSILSALRHYLGTGVPVFAVNYGEVGFLATVDPDGLEEGLGRALDGDFDAMSLPAIDLR